MAVAARWVSPCALVLVASSAACSGAATQDLFDGTTSESNDTSATEPSPSAPSSPSTGDTPSGAPTTSTPEPAPAPAPAGDPAPAPAVCTPEAEPNDDAAKATPFTTSLCGAIGSQNDVDYATFVVPNDAATVRVKHTEKNGKVAYRYFVGLLPLGSDPGAVDPVAGATYTVQIRRDRNGGGGNLPTYELEVSFQ